MALVFEVLGVLGGLASEISYHVPENMADPDFLAKQWREIWRDYSAAGSFNLLILASLGMVLFDTRLGLVLIVAIIAVEVICSLVKLAARRTRPDNQTGSSFLERIDSGSFPSIHTARMAAVGALLIGRLPSLEMTIIVGAAVILVGVSRVILKRHHLSDVLAGAVLGVLFGWLIFYLVPFS